MWGFVHYVLRVDKNREAKHDLRMLYPYIGIKEDGSLGLFISPSKLNPLSAMHERGRPFQAVAYDFPKGKEIEALRSLSAYYDPNQSKHDHGPLIFGQQLPTRKRK